MENSNDNKFIPQDQIPVENQDQQQAPIPETQSQQAPQQPNFQEQSFQQPQGQPYGQPQGQSYGQNQGQSYGQPQGQPYQQPQGQPYGQPQGQPYRQPPVKKPANENAILSLVLGIASIILSCSGATSIAFGISGLILGFMARKKEKDGTSMAGIVTSCVGIGITVVVLLIVAASALVNYVNFFDRFPDFLGRW